jgi:hypothetical protein
MIQVRITSISGGTYPINVYIADVYGNNKSLLGTISSGVPPTVSYNSVIPAIFQTAPEIMLILTDSSGCEVFQILDCTFGCAFAITIQLASCIIDMTIQEASCTVSITSDLTVTTP